MILAVVLVSVIGVTWAVSAQYDATPTVGHKVSDENVTANVGAWTATDVPDYAIVIFDNETVTSSDGTTTYSEGLDYRWSTENGSIYVESGGSISDGETLLVDYAYTSKPQEARKLHGIISVPVNYVLPSSILIVLAVSVAGLTVAIVRYVGGGTGPSSSRNLGR